MFSIRAFVLAFLVALIVGAVSHFSLRAAGHLIGLTLAPHRGLDPAASIASMIAFAIVYARTTARVRG